MKEWFKKMMVQVDGVSEWLEGWKMFGSSKWYRGEEFKLFSFVIGEKNTDVFTCIELQFGKFIFGFGFIRY